MSESAEFTTRDVLDQLNQRMARVEDDLRSTRNELINRMGAGFGSVRAEMSAEIGSVHGDLRELSNKADRSLRWSVGIVLASWMSAMATILLK